MLFGVNQMKSNEMMAQRLNPRNQESIDYKGDTAFGIPEKWRVIRIVGNFS